MYNTQRGLLTLALVGSVIQCGNLQAAEKSGVTAMSIPDYEIKSYCVDFNWTAGGRKGQNNFAKPGEYAAADPKGLVEWHKAIGSNVIQTFCVSHNGYAWYKSDVTPPQPGLKHDFLREVVKLGHAEDMLVMGYLSIAANTRWGDENPSLSYGSPSTYHLPYTDEYLAYLDKAIRDAVTTGIDGFMLDWIWQPKRSSTNGKWIDSEKKLYEQLMGEKFPGEDKLSEKKDTEYSRKAIDRCWKTIRKAAKQVNPDCAIWLTCNKLQHPHIDDSDMLKEIDWLLAESGNVKNLEKIKSFVGKHTKLIVCLAAWNNKDPAFVIPSAKENKLGLYGFCKPRTKDGRIPMDKFLSKQLTELVGDDRNIAALARAYQGLSLESELVDGKFVEPKVAPAYRLQILAGGRGSANRGTNRFSNGSGEVKVNTPHRRGALLLTRLGDTWPETVNLHYWTIKREKNEKDMSAVQTVTFFNGKLGCEVAIDEKGKTRFGAPKKFTINVNWARSFKVGGGDSETKPITVPFTSDKNNLKLVIPKEILTGNPETIAVAWGKRFVAK